MGSSHPENPSGNSTDPIEGDFDIGGQVPQQSVGAPAWPWTGLSYQNLAVYHWGWFSENAQ